MKKYSKPNKVDIFYKKTKVVTFDKKFLDSSKWPKHWKKIYTKLYPRLTKVKLSKNISTIERSFSEILFSRKSERNFNAKKELSKKTLSCLLFHSAGIKPENIKPAWDETRRFYPSAGARYPLETYLVVNKVNSLPKGLYHYSVPDHSLDVLWLNNNLSKQLASICGQKWVVKAQIIFIITAAIERTMTKYKDRGGRYILIETGHLAQNIYLVATALNLKVCAIGGFKDDKINSILDLDEEAEKSLYIICVGS